jgi:hypothetical protein
MVTKYSLDVPLMAVVLLLRASEVHTAPGCNIQSGFRRFLADRLVAFAGYNVQSKAALQEADADLD